MASHLMSTIESTVNVLNAIQRAIGPFKQLPMAEKFYLTELKEKHCGFASCLRRSPLPMARRPSQ
eukprot:2000093-Lingulodinium_polyedra.AAC.1